MQESTDPQKAEYKRSSIRTVFLVHSGHCHRMPRTGWLTRPRFISPSSVGCKSKVEVLVIWCLERRCFAVHSPQTSCYVLTWQKGRQSSLRFFFLFLHLWRERTSGATSSGLIVSFRLETSLYSCIHLSVLICRARDSLGWSCGHERDSTRPRTARAAKQTPVPELTP